MGKIHTDCSSSSQLSSAQSLTTPIRSSRGATSPPVFIKSGPYSSGKRPGQSKKELSQRLSALILDARPDLGLVSLYLLC